jgi:hypothetical protein
MLQFVDARVKVLVSVVMKKLELFVRLMQIHLPEDFSKLSLKRPPLGHMWSTNWIPLRSSRTTFDVFILKT